ncbi:MAG: aminomethyl transferase family protein, partial [Alphaproteobacteria bacterium]
GDFTITALAPDRFRLTASYSAQAMHMRWFERQREGFDVTVRNLSDRVSGFQIAGPRARALLERVAGPEAGELGFLEARRLGIGNLDALVQRLSYTGDLGYEIFVDLLEVRRLWQLLTEAGADLGLAPFGMRAMMSLRLDRHFGSWLREYRPEYTPAETGLDRFIDFARADRFIGGTAAVAERERGPSRRLVMLEIDALDADVWGDEPIWHDGAVVGFCTSGGWSHWQGCSMAFGFLPLALAGGDPALEVEILGERRPARIVPEPRFRPAP